MGNSIISIMFWGKFHKETWDLSDYPGKYSQS